MPAPKLIRPEHKRAFVSLVADGRPVTSICQEMGVARHTMYWHRDRDPAFHRAWAEARLAAARPPAVPDDGRLRDAGGGLVLDSDFEPMPLPRRRANDGPAGAASSAS